MIIGYNFFSRGMGGSIFDTAIPTSNIDVVKMGAGIYDELYVTVDGTIPDTDVKPTKWQLKTIMNAKFQNDLEAGSLDSDGHVIKKIQIYRRKYLLDDNWLLVGEFDYDIEYNTYSFVDRFTENGARYEYAIVPVAQDVIGDMELSSPIDVNFEGLFISDLEGNYRMEVDYELGQITHNENMSSASPLNGKYPIVTRGTQDYRTGDITFLPLSNEQVESFGTTINGRTERKYRNQVVNFLKNGSAKVIRNDNGEMMIVTTHGVTETSKNGQLVDLHAISFSFTELGGFDFDTMSKGGLIGSAGKSKYTFDENGEIIWTMSYMPTARTQARTYSTSSSEVM